MRSNKKPCKPTEAPGGHFSQVARLWWFWKKDCPKSLTPLNLWCPGYLHGEEDRNGITDLHRAGRLIRMWSRPSAKHYFGSLLFFIRMVIMMIISIVIIVILIMNILVPQPQTKKTQKVSTPMQLWRPWALGWGALAWKVLLRTRQNPPKSVPSRWSSPGRGASGPLPSPRHLAPRALRLWLCFRA